MNGTSIRYRAGVESIHSSTSIEGSPLNIDEVCALVSSDKIWQFVINYDFLRARATR